VATRLPIFDETLGLEELDHLAGRHLRHPRQNFMAE
jgi:hypothetical protein